MSLSVLERTRGSASLRALVLGVSVLAVLVASVLPARRAARLSPVEGLATE